MKDDRVFISLKGDLHVKAFNLMENCLIETNGYKVFAERIDLSDGGNIFHSYHILMKDISYWRERCLAAKKILQSKGTI